MIINKYFRQTDHDINFILLNYIEFQLHVGKLVCAVLMGKHGTNF